MRVTCKVRRCIRDFRVLPYDLDQIKNLDNILRITDILLVCSSIVVVVFTTFIDENRIKCALQAPWDYYLYSNDGNFIGLTNLTVSIAEYNSLIIQQSQNLNRLSELYSNYNYNIQAYQQMIENMTINNQNTTLDNPDPLNMNSPVIPNVIQALPSMSNESSISGSLNQIYYLYTNRTAKILIFGQSIQQFLEYSTSSQQWTQSLQNNDQIAQDLRAKFIKSQQNSLSYFIWPTILGFYCLYSLCVLVGLIDIIYYLWFDHFLMPKIWASKKQRQEQRTQRGSNQQDEGRLFTKRSTIRAIYMRFYFNCLILICCGGGFITSNFLFFVSVDECALSRQKLVSELCSSNSNNSLSDTIGVSNSLLTMIQAGLTKDELNQYNLLNYPSLVKEWLEIVNYEDLTSSPPAVQTLTQTIQLGPSSTSAREVLQELNSWANYYGAESNQTIVGQCQVLEDEVEFVKGQCPFKMYRIKDYYENIGLPACVLIQDPNFIQQRLNLVNFNDCRTTDDYYGSVKQNYLIRFSQLYQYQQNLLNQVTIPLTNALDEIDELGVQIDTNFQQQVRTINENFNAQLLNQSQSIYSQTNCDPVDSQENYQWQFLCYENLNTWFILTVMSLVQLFLMFVFTYISYLLTSRKTFVMMFSEAQNNSIMELAEFQRQKTLY